MPGQIKKILQELSRAGLLMMSQQKLSRFMGEESNAMQASSRVPRVNGSVAIIPVHGITTYYDTFFGVNTNRIVSAIGAAVSEKRIKGIVLDIDSPGGLAAGNQEASDAIFAMRGRKPIVALADPTMASAAYYVGSAADKIYASPSGDIGSLGTYAMHVDDSELLKSMGIEVEYIYAGRNKVEGAHGPLPEDARAYIQSQIDEMNNEFMASVARNRGVSKSVVGGESWGEGRTLLANQAKAVGMIDGVMSLPELLTKMGGSASLTGSRSEDSVLTERLQLAWKNTDPLPVSDESQRQRDRDRAWALRWKLKESV